jgi:Big-like domain-containing protein
MYANRKMLSSRRGLAVLSALSAGLLTACGGGGGYDSPPPQPPAAQAPTIVGLADQSLPQDTSTPVLNFQVSDADSGADSVTVTATSSDTAIIPAEGIVLGGSGANRTLQITPAPEIFGDAMITLRATDPGGLSAQQVVRVTVNGVFVSFTTTVNDWFALDENDDEPVLSGFTFTLDADDNPAAFDALLQ